jgi:DNA invertase Pin-like site-specific DNA recombinase
MGTGAEDRGIGFRSLTESIDTTPSGEWIIFHVFGALGQFERGLISDRTQARLVATAARGRKGAAARLKTGKAVLYVALEATSAADF